MIVFVKTLDFKGRYISTLSLCQYLISLYPSTKDLVKSFRRVISKVRVMRLLVILHKVVQGQ